MSNNYDGSAIQRLRMLIQKGSDAQPYSHISSSIDSNVR